MRYDRDIWRRGSRSRADLAGRGEYGEAYEGPFPRPGWSEGFLGGELRSRGSWTAGETGFGTNYDIEHGYRVGGQGFRPRAPRGGPGREGASDYSSPRTHGGYGQGEAEPSEEYGPARYGYGPYFDRLRRRRRSDDELRQEVEDTLFYDTWVDADAISISVAEAVVTLRGTLRSYDELRYAVDDAWDVDGVRGVRSELEVHEEGAAEPSRISGRYEVGAPHMHGHPHAGEDDAGTAPDRHEERGAGGGDARATAGGGPPASGRATAGQAGRKTGTRARGDAGAANSGGPRAGTGSGGVARAGRRGGGGVKGERGGRGDRADRADGGVGGATSAPPTGKGMAAARVGGGGRSRRAGPRGGDAGGGDGQPERTTGGGTPATGAAGQGGPATGERTSGAAGSES